MPQADIDNAPTNYNPLGHATEQTTNLDPARSRSSDCGAGFQPQQLCRCGQQKGHRLAPIIGSTPASNPLPEITDALDNASSLRPNIGRVLGCRASATILRRHLKIVKAYNGTLGDEGMVPMAFLAGAAGAGRRSTSARDG
ncbi:hypothetical protein P4050_30580 [Pseudomonas aeruginosa]|nr:hypothetical protein [Pseudomonas aeruginosa]